jgi:urease accessory protein
MMNGTVALHGQMVLTAAVEHGRTVLRESSATPPFHTGRPSDRHGDGRAEVIVQGVGPGQLPGDEYLVSIRAEVGSRLVVRGQAANRIYPSPHGIPATSTTRLTACAESTLVYLPGEVIPYQMAMLEQSTTVIAAGSARVAFAEILTPGRHASGEHYAFTRLDHRTRVYVDDALIIQDRALLQPGDRSLTSVGRTGQNLVTATLFLIGPGWQLPQTRLDGDAISATGKSEGFIVVRILGNSAQRVNRRLVETIREAGFHLSL